MAESWVSIWELSWPLLCCLDVEAEVATVEEGGINS